MQGTGDAASEAAGPTWTTDATRGQVLAFDGNDDWVDAGFIPALAKDTDDFTWAFWTYQVQVANSDVALGNRYQADSQTGSQWVKFTADKFEYLSSGSNVNHVDYDNIPQNVWVHHAVVKSGSTLTYYRNGSVPASGEATHAIASDLASQPFYMGGDKYAERWQGSLDDVALWTDALSADAIAGLADGTYTPLTVPVPEPSTMLLSLLGLSSAAFVAWRRRKTA